MKYEIPSQVLITGGHEIGGVASFAEGLRVGFTELGIPVSVVSPSEIFSHWRDLHDPQILKILSTTAIYAAPFARRALCMAHGVPLASAQGWCKMIAILASHKLANLFSGIQVVAVSHYTAAVLRGVFNTRCDAVIHNPLKPLYLQSDAPPGERCYVTYVGRLIAAKNLHRMIPAIRDLLDEVPDLRACIVGEGKMRAKLEAMVNGDSRFEFKGTPDDATVRNLLLRTRVFVSGHELEGFGITYLEAMSQGCIVAMPAAGGGLEIASDKVGKSVQLLPLSWNREGVLAALRRALQESWTPIATESYTSRAIANLYLQVDSNFLPDGRVLARN